MNIPVSIPLEKPNAYVKDILFLEDKKTTGTTHLPFYADGYPGIMFYSGPAEVHVLPKKKKLPDFMFYGQTLYPIELSITGPYRLIVFQLFPSTVKSLLDINPRDFTDECYDLLLLQNITTADTITQLRKTKAVSRQVNIMLDFVGELSKQTDGDIDHMIRLAINMILESRGNITIKDLREKLYVSERTFERQFSDRVGVTPKQFARIIQFQLSLNNLTEKDYQSLTDIAFANGFADQSHFIKAFRKFTGKTPKEFQKRQ